MTTLYDAPDCWKCVEVKAALVAAQGEPPQVPMIVDGDVAVWDRRRILAYIAETYGDGPPADGPSYRDMPSFVGGTCRVDGGGGDC